MRGDEREFRGSLFCSCDVGLNEFIVVEEEPNSDERNADINTSPNARCL